MFMISEKISVLSDFNVQIIAKNMNTEKAVATK